MKTLKDEKGFTLIELVLVIVVLGILGAVATVQFGNLVKDANGASLDAAPGNYNAQIALAINTLKTVPTCAQFDTEVFQKVSNSGGKITYTQGACTSGARTVTMQIVAATCVDVWTYDDGSVTPANTGKFTRTSSTRTGC